MIEPNCFEILFVSIELDRFASFVFGSLNGKLNQSCSNPLFPALRIDEQVFQDGFETTKPNGKTISLLDVANAFSCVIEGEEEFGLTIPKQLP